MKLTPGATYVHVGIGVVRIEKVSDEGIEVADLDGDRFDIESDEIEDVLRPVISSERAAILYDSLTDPPSAFSQDPPGRRSRHYVEVFEEGTIDEQVDALRAIIHDPRNEPAETQNRKRFEALVLGELSTAQSITIGDLQSRLARALRTPLRPIDVLPDRSSEIPPVDSIPTCPGLRTIGAFYVERQVGAGEAGLGQTFEVGPGLWFAYGSTELAERSTGTDSDDGDRHPEGVLMAIRADRADSAERMRRWAAGEGVVATGDRVPIDGARVMIADAEAARDHDYIETV
ncbi:MAG: hypothetical protein AAFO29_11940, partial [Actinomycetota bacterium]